MLRHDIDQTIRLLIGGPAAVLDQFKAAPVGVRWRLMEFIQEFISDGTRRVSEEDKLFERFCPEGYELRKSNPELFSQLVREGIQWLDDGLRVAA